MAAIGTSGCRPRRRRAWRTCSARTCRFTTRWPTRSPCATATTARCSVRPTPTATTCGPAGTGTTGKGGGPVIANDELGYSWQTYPERLQAAGISWKIYQDIGDGLDAAGIWGFTSDPYIGNYGDNSLLYFLNYQNAAPGSPLYRAGSDRNRRQNDVRSDDGNGLFNILADDVKHGRLPSVSWIAAPEAYTEHPVWPAGYGALYTAGVLNALTSNPEVWSKTALLITFDENDGFFDHVIGPYPNVGGLAGQSTVPLDNELFEGTAGTPGGSNGVVGPYGLGVRVPLLAVSPWSKGGWVCSEMFDHTSLIRFIEARFGVRRTQHHAVAARRLRRPDLGVRFRERVRSRPGAARRHPLQAEPSTTPPSYHPMPPAVGSVPTQEHGVRPSRRLGYRFDVAFDAEPRQAQPRGQEPRQARRSPPGTIADRRRRALQLHDRRRRLVARRVAEPRHVRPQPPRPKRLLPPLRRLPGDGGAGRGAIPTTDVGSSGSGSPTACGHHRRPVVVDVADAYGPDRQIRCTAQERSRSTPATPAAGTTSRSARRATPASATSSRVDWSPAPG